MKEEELCVLCSLLSESVGTGRDSLSGTLLMSKSSTAPLRMNKAQL